jgi:hypothetical protein
MPSDRIRKILPPDTAATWDAIAPLVPPGAYLGGGTAIAVHLGHRVSRDLDFFFHHGSIAATGKSPRTCTSKKSTSTTPVTGW